MGLPLVTQPAWQLVKDKKGIKVYTANSKVTHLKAVRVTAVVDGTLEKLISIFKDVENQKRWVYGTKQSYSIKRINDNEILYYVETGLPWPVNNRDIAILMKIKKERAKNQLKVTMMGAPSAIPLNKGKERVSYFSGIWIVKAINKDKISIDYILDVDPGGQMPSWAVNLFIAKGPYQTFSKLSEILKE